MNQHPTPWGIRMGSIVKGGPVHYRVIDARHQLVAECDDRATATRIIGAVTGGSAVQEACLAVARACTVEPFGMWVAAMEEAAQECVAALRHFAKTEKANDEREVH